MKTLVTSLFLLILPLIFSSCEKDYDLIADYVVNDELTKEADNVRNYQIEVRAIIQLKNKDGRVETLSQNSVDIKSSLELDLKDNEKYDSQLIEIDKTFRTDLEGQVVFLQSFRVEKGQRVIDIDTKGITLSTTQFKTSYKKFIPVGNTLVSKGYNYMTVTSDYGIQRTITEDKEKNLVNVLIEIEKPIILELPLLK